jgi:hypothetical protein
MKQFADKLLLILAFLILAFQSHSVIASASRSVSISFPVMKFEDTDHIIGFQLTIKGGSITAVEKTKGWAFGVGTNESSEAVVFGNVNGTKGPNNSAELPIFTVEREDSADNTPSDFSVGGSMLFMPKSAKARSIEFSHDMMIIKKKASNQEDAPGETPPR